MNRDRWDEIKLSLGFNILLPRFALFVFLPCCLLICAPAPPQAPLLLTILAPAYVRAVVAVCLLAFTLSVAANLAVSRDLRRHETPDSPYTYEAVYDPSRRSEWFRIQARDKKALNRLLRDLRRTPGGGPVRFWLWVDHLLFLPAVSVLGLFITVFLVLPILLKVLWDHRREIWPAPEH